MVVLDRFKILNWMQLLQIVHFLLFVKFSIVSFAELLYNVIQDFN